MSYVTCKDCRGRKVYTSLGFMEYQCEGCKGVGYIEKEERYKKPTPVFKHFNKLVKKPKQSKVIVDNNETDNVVQDNNEVTV